MNLTKIGSFLATLRQEQNLTQEQLGENIGVTNKTISRWENGNYLPPVEMLQTLGELYQVSINEILTGERIAEQDYKEKAEENIKAALKESTFSLKEKMDFFKKKWKKDHVALILIGIILPIIIFVLGIIFYKGLMLLALPMAFIIYIALYNRMMIYVEANAFKGKGEN